MNFFQQLLQQLLGGPSVTAAFQALLGTLNPLFSLMFTTPLEFTTANDAVFGLWKIMVGASDIFMGLLVVIGCIQMMYGEVTGSTYMPPGQFIARAVLSVILVHISWMFGQDLILFNNELCLVFRVNADNFLTALNNGQALGTGNILSLSTVLVIFGGFALARLVFQAVKRIVFIDVLFIFTGPAVLLAFQPQTSAFTSFWARTFVTTIFTQTLQVAAFAISLQFITATHQQGLTVGFLGIAMLYLTAEIPSLLSRFAASAGASANGVGTVVRALVMASSLAA